MMGRHERGGARAAPWGFQWGVATSAYQIEGAVDADGRRPSIWDRFCRTPGRIADASTGDEACRHYDRWAEDIEAMAALGLDAYRFSVAWPRVIPEGEGPVNMAGLDFYDRLVDGLLAAGIEPFVTLYHWDLPASLEDLGGWRRRETAHAFTAYATAVADRLGDRVQNWVTQNEPWVVSMLGHAEGEHAPGMKDRGAALAVAHHLLLSHGLATQVLRARCRRPPRVGLSKAYIHTEPRGARAEDLDAARAADGSVNRWFLDPLYGRGYPEDVVADYRAQGALPRGDLPFVERGDLEVIATETDFLGVNYYTRARPGEGPAEVIAPERCTDMGWEIYPDGLRQGLLRLHDEYAPGELIVTENGAAFATGPGEDGRIHDARRIAYLREHIDALWAAKAAGAPVGGYFLWSLLDNFEWAYGYAKRFGLYWVDFATGERIAKDSARWYREEIRRRRAEAAAAQFELRRFAQEPAGGSREKTRT